VNPAILIDKLHSPRLILAHQGRKADDVGKHDGCELMGIWHYVLLD
jgi:hypothetical protein